MAMFDDDWFYKGSGAENWIDRQRTALRKKKEDEQSYAAELAEGAKKEEAKKAEEKKGDNIPKKAGRFVRDAAVDVKDTTVGAYQGVTDMVRGASATREMADNTDKMNRNSKEWADYMRTLPEGDEEAWSKPEVQEKLKEFRYKAKLLRGDTINPNDIPANARGERLPDQQKFALGKDGSVELNPTFQEDPYAGLTPVSDRARRDMKELNDQNAAKLAAQTAETFLNVATLGVGTGLKAGAKTAIKQGVKAGAKSAGKAVVGTGGKELAKNAGKDAIIGGAYGITTTLRNDPTGENTGLDDYSRNILLGASIGAAAPVVIKGGMKLAGKTDKAAGQAVAKTAAQTENESMRRALTQIGQDGIVGTLNKSFSRAGRKIVYAASDAVQKTKPGAAMVDFKDDFMTKWVSNFHPLYKELKRTDFEGKTDGAYLAAREAIGNSNRALSYAQDFLEYNPNMQQLTGSLAARGKDLVKTREAFDEFAKVRSELDLVGTGKKEFSQAKLQELSKRMEAFNESHFGEEYKNLVNFYKDLNTFRLENGLISQKQYDEFAEEGFDYVRQQRELPEWMLDKPAFGAMGGSKASITGSEAVQKRNKYASAELLSPMETAIRTAQLAHVEAYRNKAAKTVYGLLDEAGEAQLVRSTDVVREKQALILEMKETRPIATKMQKVVRAQTKQVKQLMTQINNLNKEGLNVRLKDKNNQAMPEFTPGGLGGDVPTSQAGRGPIAVNDKLSPAEYEILESLGIKNNPSKLGRKDTMAFLNNLVSQDPAGIKRIRSMIESRDAKLGPLLDTLEVASRDLHDIYAKRKGLYQSAQGLKTSVDKGKMTSISFLDDGVENIVKVDPDVAAAVHNWHKESQNVIVDVMRRANNVFKYGTTGANPGFILPNFVADQISSGINSKSAWATHNPVNFVHSLFMSIGKPLTAEDAEIMRMYAQGNRRALSINQYSRPASADKAANELVARQASRGARGLTSIKHPIHAMRQLYQSTEGLVGFTENLTRQQNFRGTYKKALKTNDDAGATTIANQAARENSVDFLEAGDYGRMINNFLPYFNAAIQGNRTMLRAATERPVSFAGKMTALIGAPVAASTIWNTSDEKRKQIYDTIPEYIKEGNFVVVTPNASWNEKEKKWDGVWLARKPPGYKEFAEPVRRFIEYKADNGGTADMQEYLRNSGEKNTLDLFSVVVPIDFSSPEKFVSSVTPQILKPTLEAVLNRNMFQGQDIVKESMEDLPPEEQKYDQYSQFTANIAGIFNTSPLKVDHWIKQTFGEVGLNAVNTIDRTTGAPDEAVGGRSIGESVERRFQGAPGGADTDAFYEAYTPAMSNRRYVSKKVTELVKAGRINEAKRRAEDYNNSIKERFGPFFEKYGESPNYNEDWNEMIDALPIKTTEESFKARRRQ